MTDKTRRRKRQRSVLKLLILMPSGLLALLLLLYSVLHWQRPPRTAQVRSLFQGITYRREAFDQPRLMVVHIVTVDLTAPGLSVLVTPGQRSTDGPPDRKITTEVTARTTTEFLQAYDLQLAVNASFFYPFVAKTPWNFYPRSGDGVNAVGLAIANGQPYSEPKQGWPALCFAADSRAQITASGSCPAETQQAVAGSPLLVSQGKAVPLSEDLNPVAYPRTVAATDPAGETLWLIVVDSKQPFYSEGATLPELAQIALNLGADAALNLDGGGSTTLAAAGPNRPQLLNAPIHTRIPLRQRPVANHIGFYARPLPTSSAAPGHSAD